MSSSFDRVQHALCWLLERVDKEDAQAEDVIYFVKEVVNKWHDLDHDLAGKLNRKTGHTSDLLLTALKYSDDKERATSLERKREV